MKTSRIFLTIIMLTLTILVFTGCQGVVPTPSPGATEDPTIIIGKIKMPWACCAIGEEPIEDEPIGHYTDGWSIIPDAIVEIRDVNNCNKLLYSTIADENGYYEFKDIKPGHYIITAICPVEENYILKDVAEKKEGITLNAGIPDCDSTALALVIEYIKGCFEDYSCFPKRDNSEVYKQVGKIVSIINRKNIPLIEGYVNIWNLKDKDLEEFDKLVELVCDRLMACCFGTGTTPIRPQPDPGPTPDPCATNSPPENIQLDPLSATVGEKYSGTITADDADDDDLTFAFHGDFTPPGDMKIVKTARNKAKITWTPTEGDICNCGESKSDDLARIAASIKACEPLRIIVSDICHPEGVEEVFCLEVVPTYTITYNGNGNTGGAVPTDSNSYYEGDGATVLDEDTLVKTNYHFTGWNTQADGNGDDYAPDATLTMPTSNVTLYAQWTENKKYTVTYNLNGGTSALPTEPDHYAGDKFILASTPTRANYTFTGWLCDDDSQTYAAGVEYTMPAKNVKFTAQWKKSCVNFTIDVDYDVDSKKGHSDSILYWYAPPNHISTSGGRDYVKVTITADRDLVAGEQVILDFSQKSKSSRDPGKIMLEVSGYTGQTSTNGIHNNNTGLVTFSGPLSAGQEFYAIFRKATHDWGNRRYPTDTKVTLKVTSDIACSNPTTADILFDDEETNI